MEVLGFLVTVAVRMLDPVTLVLAALIGWGVSYPQQAGTRWFLVGLGAVGLAVASIRLGAYVDAQYGQARSATPERIASTVAAHFLQIAIAMALIRWIRLRKAVPRQP